MQYRNLVIKYSDHMLFFDRDANIVLHLDIKQLRNTHSRQIFKKKGVKTVRFWLSRQGLRGTADLDFVSRP